MPGGRRSGRGRRAVAYAAVARAKDRPRYDEPGGERIATFGALNANGHAMVFGVRRVVLGADCKNEWYRVALPIRPNGVEGYVRADDVRLLRVPTRITIELSERELVLYRDGEPVLRSAVAIGAPDTPTPTGRYYVNQRLIAVRSRRAVGPRRARHLGVLRCAPGVDPGRADRDPRHERPFVDRRRCLARLRPPAERRAHEGVQAADAGTPVIIQA